MASAPRDDPKLFEAYRNEFVDSQLPGYARLGSGVAFGINTAFMVLDYVSFPERFHLFMAMRLGLDALFVGAFLASNRYPRAAAWSICLALGVAMLAMIFATGGAVSPYFAGLMLLFMGMGIVMPLSGLEAAAICGVILLPYLALPWIGPAGSLEWEVFRIYAVFLVSAAAECVASCLYLEHMRFKDFKQREELQQARDHLELMDRAKSRFTANIHHELRTPLTLTLAPIEGMLAGEFGDITRLQREYLKTAEVNSLRLLKLINNLLDLAKLESEQFDLHRAPLDTGRMVSEILNGVRPMAERKGIELVSRCRDGVPVIYADADAFEKILINLLGNALKFTESGGRIAVELEPAEKGAGVMLRVVDSGIGIPREQLDRIFDRFAQVDASSTRSHGGTGIGLSLCHELVDLHGGNIWAESEGVGRGTRMCVWLPAGEATEGDAERVLATDEGQSRGARRSMASLETEIDTGSQELEREFASEATAQSVAGEAPAIEASVETAADSAPESAPEILVVDDNPDIRRLIGQLLRREFRLRMACNGREALDMVRERTPALILTDVMMPEMSGTDLCREIKSSPATEGIPVMLVTSNAERSMKIDGLELGADDYVVKPFHARELLARVRSLVRLRLLQDALEERNMRLEAANLRVESALTELKQMQVQLVLRERLVVAGELAAGIAHEANNPLNFAANANRALMKSLADVEDIVREIFGLRSAKASDARAALEKVDRLCEERNFDSTTETLRELTGIIQEGLERTARLVGDLRAFAGPIAMREETLDVRAGLESTLQLMGYSLRESGIEVEIEADADLPLLVGDPRSLNQVFLNLLKNARDAMNGHGGKIHVRLFSEDDVFVVRIRDEGPGIPEELRETLFEPFCTSKGPGGGSGLGLSISRNILHSQHGSLDLVETSERGTTFEVRLPLPDDD